jgi:hypothetical protein
VRTDLGRVAERVPARPPGRVRRPRPRPIPTTARGLLRRRRGSERADRARGLGAELPAILDGLRAGRVGGQARRRRDLARRVHPALGVARRSPLNLVRVVGRFYFASRAPPDEQKIICRGWPKGREVGLTRRGYGAYTSVHPVFASAELGVPLGSRASRSVVGRSTIVILLFQFHSHRKG